MLESQIAREVNGPNLFVDYTTEMAGSFSGMAIPLRVQYTSGKKLTRIRLLALRRVLLDGPGSQEKGLVPAQV